MRTFEKFNQSGFAHFMNSNAGRVFRMLAGVVFLTIGYVFRAHWLGVVSMVFSVLPLTAGAFDLCFISAILGGPVSGARIRSAHHPQFPSQVRHPS